MSIIKLIGSHIHCLIIKPNLSKNVTINLIIIWIKTITRQQRLRNAYLEWRFYCVRLSYCWTWSYVANWWWGNINEYTGKAKVKYQQTDVTWGYYWWRAYGLACTEDNCIACCIGGAWGYVTKVCCFCLIISWFVGGASCYVTKVCCICLISWIHCWLSLSDDFDQNKQVVAINILKW